MPALWSGQRLVQYLRAIGANSGADLRNNGYQFPGFTPGTIVHIYAERVYDGFATYHKSAYDKLLSTTGWYSLSSPVEMFAEMYTRRYESGATPPQNNGKHPATFFAELERQRDPMFGEPPPDQPPPVGP